MTTNYIYLLQEKQCIENNIYKVGVTNSFNDFSKDSTILVQIYCSGITEEQIIKQFIRHFKMIDNCFEGTYKKMIDIIYLTIKNQEIYQILYNEFPDFQNDESFGGIKKYMKIKQINNGYIFYFIRNETEILDNNCIYEHELNKSDYNLDNLDNLIKNNILMLNTVYDIFSDDFNDAMNKTKLRIKINNDNYNLFFKHIGDFNCIIEEKIRKLFLCNIIINDTLYFIKKSEDNDYNFIIETGIKYYVCKNPALLNIYKINSQYYDYGTLRNYVPYKIIWNNNNDYFIVNYDYNKTINTENKSVSYVFNDNCKPWDEKEYFINMCNEYSKIIKENLLKNCLNPNILIECIC